MVPFLAHPVGGQPPHNISSRGRDIFRASVAINTKLMHEIDLTYTSLVETLLGRATLLDPCAEHKWVSKSSFPSG